MEDNDKREQNIEINKQEEKQEVIEVKKEEPTKEVEVKQEESRVENKNQVKDRKGLAIASMVLGIVALVLFCIWYTTVPCAVLAIVFGIISIKSSGRGMAIAGITTGIIGFVLMILLYGFIIAVGIGAFNNLDDSIRYYKDHDYDYHYNVYDDYDNEWF